MTNTNTTVSISANLGISDLLDLLGLYETSSYANFFRDEIFDLLLSSNTWELLTPTAKEHLKQKYWPTQSTTDLNLTDIKPLFQSANSTRAIANHQAVQDGLLGEWNFVFETAFPNVSRSAAKLRRLHRSICQQAKINYECWLRNYYVKTLETLLISRKIILHSRLHLGETDKQPTIHLWPSANNASATRRRKSMGALWHRGKMRAKLMTEDIGQTFGEHSAPSDSDDDESPRLGKSDSQPKNTTQAILPLDEKSFWHLQRNGSSACSTIVSATLKDVALNQELRMSSVSDLLEQYKYLLEFQPDHPSLEFSDISLADIVSRAGMDSFVQKFAPSLLRSTLKDAEPQRPSVAPNCVAQTCPSVTPTTAAVRVSPSKNGTLEATASDNPLLKSNEA